MAATSRHRSGFATKPIFPLHLSQNKRLSAEVMTRIVAAVAAYFRISTRSEIGEGGPRPEARPISGWHKWPSGWQQYRLGSAQNSMHQRNQPIKMPPVSMSQFQPVGEQRLLFTKNRGWFVKYRTIGAEGHILGLRAECSFHPIKSRLV